MVKINLNIDDNILEKIDKFAKNQDKNRSEFIREAIETFISFKNQEEKLKKRSKKIEEAIKFFDKISKKNKDWDGVTEIIKIREDRNIL